MRRKTRRLYGVVAGLVLLGAAAALVLAAMEDKLVFFYGPSELSAQEAEDGRRIRVGGLVEDGSVERAGDGLTVRFRVTDLAASLPVRYSGVLPDLFAEGQGVVAEGRLGADGVFAADTILAKHDENYMPPEVADMLEEGARRAGDGG